jgi:hemerythrin-like domain-containing protein
MNSNRKKKSGKSGAGRAIGRAVRLVQDSLSSQESAIDLLKSQHEEVRTLFKRIEKASGRAQKTKLFDELAAKLVGHDAIEREIFYPACEQAMGMTDLLGEALVEHGVVEFALYQADQARQAKDFQFKCTVLSELVEHHVQEEEQEFLPKAEKALGRDRLEELGTEMQARFEEALAEGDFRTPLQSNLKQVMAGAIKPSKRGAAARGGRGSSGKRRKAA